VGKRRSLKLTNRVSSLVSRHRVNNNFTYLLSSRSDVVSGCQHSRWFNKHGWWWRWEKDEFLLPSW